MRVQSDSYSSCKECILWRWYTTHHMNVGTFAFIQDKEKRVLMVKDMHQGKQWTLPGGGIDFKELVNEALVREVKEETSLRVTVGQILGIFSQQKTPGIVILFAVDVLEGIPSPDGEEISECRYFSFGELLALKDAVMPAQLSMVYQVLHGSIFPIFNSFPTPA